MSRNFIIYLSLLWTILDFPVNSVPMSPNIKVSNKAFAKELSNPCASTDESSLGSIDSQHTSLRATLLRMISEISSARKTAEAILKSGDLGELRCISLMFATDDKIPLAQNFQNDTTVEAIRLFYTSLVNRTAYVFFISEQIENLTSYCSLDTALNEAEKLASQMQAVMCSFRKLAIALQGSANDSMKDAHKQIFNEEFIDISMCSRLIFNTCFILQNSQKLLTELLSYLRTMVSSQ